MANSSDVLLQLGPFLPGNLLNNGQPTQTPSPGGGFTVTQGDLTNLMTPDPAKVPAMNNLRAMGGATAQGALAIPSIVGHPIDSAMQFGGFLDNKITKPLAGNPSGSPAWPVELGKNIIQSLTVPQGKLDAQKKEKDAAASAALSSQDQAVNDRISAFDTVTGALGGGTAGSAGVDLGPAVGKNFDVPAPPPAADYAPVQAALDKTKPQMDTAGLEDRRKGSILVGLVGGLLQGAMDGNATAGQIIGMAGQGTLAGISAADQEKAKAEDGFKKAMDEYWIRTAGIKRDQVESDQQYAERVYNSKLEQLRINAQAAAANAPKIHQAGDKFFVETVVNGQKNLRPLDVSAVGRLAGMDTEMTRILGGTPDAAKKAGAIVAEVASRKDPAFALPMVAVARLKSNGTYLDLVNQLGASNPEWLKQFNSIGTQQQGTMEAGKLNDLVENRKDAMLVDAIMRIPAVQQKALSLAGMDEQLQRARGKLPGKIKQVDMSLPEDPNPFVPTLKGAN